MGVDVTFTFILCVHFHNAQAWIQKLLKVGGWVLERQIQRNFQTDKQKTSEGGLIPPTPPPLDPTLHSEPRESHQHELLWKLGLLTKFCVFKSKLILNVVNCLNMKNSEVQLAPDRGILENVQEWKVACRCDVLKFQQ